MNEDEKTFYTGDAGCKIEDAIQNLNTMKRQLVEKFKEAMHELVATAESKDPNATVNMAVALYLATYFDSNESGITYF